MISYLILFISVFVVATLSLASYSDIKTREVPDFISYMLIGGGLLLSLILAIGNDSISNLEFMPASVALLFGFSYLMYRAGQWAGGDVKLMLGLSVVFTSFSMSSSFSFINLFINILIFGGLYGLFGTIVFGLMKFSQMKKFLHLYDIGLVLGGAILIFLFIEFLPLPVNYLAAFAAFMLVSMRYIYVVAENMMFVNVHVDKLTEGDWLADDAVDESGKTIVTKKNIGLEENDIKKLKESSIKQVLVKIGLPFVPGLLIGTLITLLFWNPILQLITSNLIL